MKRRTFIGALTGFFSAFKRLIAGEIFAKGIAVFRKDGLTEVEASRIQADSTTLKINSKEWNGYPDHTVLIYSQSVVPDGNGTYSAYFRMCRKHDKVSPVKRRFTDFNRHTYGVQVE